MTLIAPGSGHRASVLRYLVSSAGRRAYEDGWSEREFHAGLRTKADAELGALLDAISSYERFSRLCQDAFDDALLEMTMRRGQKTTPRDLARLDSVQKARREVPELFGEVIERLVPYRETARFSDAFASLAERADAANWVERLLEHHIRTQRMKPPVGKSPWFERYDDGSAMLRQLYWREKGGRHDDSYLHFYRTTPLHSFARDIHLIPA